jgi:Zn finger protein HypA/HybF involved in hydrogenase expression
VLTLRLLRAIDTQSPQPDWPGRFRTWRSKNYRSQRAVAPVAGSTDPAGRQPAVAFQQGVSGCLDINVLVYPQVHELSVVEGIREIAMRHARLAGVSRILSVRVTIGEFSSYVEDALAMFWDEVCRGTEAAGARIEFHRIPGESLCLQCSSRFARSGKDFR